jgi:hypothetical protein
VDDLVFGTDNLQDDAAKLTKIYLRVKGGMLSNEEYKHTNIFCSLSDADIIDFFAKHEGNKRLAITVLLCAGFSLIQNKLNEFPVSLYDIGQAFARISLIPSIDYALMDETALDIFVLNRYQTSTRTVGVYVPEELWGMIYGISLNFKIKFSSFILYLLRTGVVKYNEFTKRSSNKPFNIPYEYITTAEKWKGVFVSSITVKYSDLLGRIKFLYNAYSDILDDGHEDLKEEMKRIIDKST